MELFRKILGELVEIRKKLQAIQNNLEPHSKILMDGKELISRPGTHDQKTHVNYAMSYEVEDKREERRREG